VATAEDGDGNDEGGEGEGAGYSESSWWEHRFRLLAYGVVRRLTEIQKFEEYGGDEEIGRWGESKCFPNDCYFLRIERGFEKSMLEQSIRPNLRVRQCFSSCDGVTRRV
jgi:hypothetical protein